MEMLNSLCAWSVRVIDYPLGWLLWLPRDVTLLLFAALTALLMTLARLAVTNQDLLRRCAEDLQRLKQLLRQTRRLQDKPTRLRLRSTVGLIKGMQLAADDEHCAVGERGHRHIDACSLHDVARRFHERATVVASRTTAGMPNSRATIAP